MSTPGRSRAPRSVKSTSSTAGGWVAFGILCALASLVWFLDNETLLRSLQPGSAWITVAVMWAEIGAPYRRADPPVPTSESELPGLKHAVAAGALPLNGIGVVMLLPAIVLG